MEKEWKKNGKRMEKVMEKDKQSKKIKHNNITDDYV